MIVFLAECGGQKWLERLSANGWGRMWARDPVRRWPEYPDEPFAFDNGAFSAWWNDKPWDADLFLRRLDHALRAGTPHFSVVPDLPAEGLRSLEFSLEWREKLPNDCQWYLAVQDGMSMLSVYEHLGKFDGIFLGGSDKFKGTAPAWCEMAHQEGINFHYARCGTVSKLRAAIDCGADSIDSSTPVQNGDDCYYEFEAVALGRHPQLELFGSVK